MSETEDQIRRLMKLRDELWRQCLALAAQVEGINLAIRLMTEGEA